jgi:hypothetical protein
MLIERWDGVRWSIESTERFRFGHGLEDVEASPSGVVFAVGVARRSANAHALVLTRAASGWRRMRRCCCASGGRAGDRQRRRVGFNTGVRRWRRSLRTVRAEVDGLVVGETDGRERRHPILDGVGASADGSVWAVGLSFVADDDAQPIAETVCA